MSTPHRATPEQWKYLQEEAIDQELEASCILELRARVEALEASARIGQLAAPANTSLPEPQAPTDEEIIALIDEIEAEELGQVDLVRRALARWGNR
jgi:hypothetical protein